MKVIDKSDATATLAEYASQIQNGPVIVTSDGRPVAALVPIESGDLESIGRHVAIYWDNEINLEVGVELDAPFAGHG